MSSLSTASHEAWTTCARTYGTEIVGGDTDQHQELTIVTTALGRVDKDKVKLRSGAKVGDLLCVTGFLGTPAAGYKVLIEGRETTPEADKKVLMERFFQAEAASSRRHQAVAIP